MAMRSVVSESGYDGPVTEMVRIGLRGEIGGGDLEGDGEGEAREAARICKCVLFFLGRGIGDEIHVKLVVYGNGSK